MPKRSDSVFLTHFANLLNDDEDSHLFITEEKHTFQKVLSEAGKEKRISGHLRYQFDVSLILNN